MINLELYRIFYTVAKSKNITKASKELNISQPAVTNHIKNLEEQLNVQLFIRTKKGVVLTECGKNIFIKVKNALTLLEESEKELDEYSKYNKGNIRIGISKSLMKNYLLKYIAKFHKKYPNITMDIETSPTTELIRELKSGMIDIVVCKLPKERDLELNYKKLGETKYIFIAGNKYKELKDKKVTPEQLLKYPILLQKSNSNSRTSIEEYFKAKKLKLNPKMVIASSTLVTDFTVIGYGIGYNTELYVEDLIKKKKIFKVNVIPAPPKIDYGIITLKNIVSSSSTNQLIKILEQKEV